MQPSDPLIEHLKAQLGSPRIVVIAGTGVSVAACDDQKVAGYPVARWIGLLEHGLDHCVRTEQVLDADEASLLLPQIKSGKSKFLVSAAQIISGELEKKRPGAYRGWLKQTVGQLRLARREVVDALASLGGVLATLNYDGLIEEATGRKALTWLDRDKVEDILRSDYPQESVLHLHGHFDHPESTVLGLASYARVANDPHAQTVLRSFALERTMLFVGCRDTMSDPNFEGLVAWAKGALADSTHRHFLLCPTDQLAAIREDLKAIPWLYPVGFGRIPDLVPFLRNLTPVAGPPVGTVRGRVSTARLDLTRYARAVRERYAHLKLESLDQTGSAYRELQLARVFVAQSVRESQEYLPQVLELPKEHLDRLRKTGHLEQEDLEAGALEELRRRYVEQPLRDALELVADPSPDLRRLVILGDPGAGKSALLQTQALRWADQAESARDDAELPLMIEIRSYAAARHDDQKLDLLDFIVDGRGIPCRLNREAVRARLDAGNACVLFDALDEAFDPGVRGEIVNGILRFANDFPAARIVVTSRVIGYQGEDFRGAGFRHYMIQELDDQQITSFLERWHAHTYPPSEAAERDQKQWRLSHAIADARPIRELAGNPLLLTMMAILNRYQDLPRGRAELYEQCARLLLQQWKVSDALRADPALTADALAIGLPEKQSLLRRLARQMQSGSSGALGNLISTSQLEGVIEEAVRPIVQGNPRAVARALIRQLRERNFILCFAGGDSYAFVHRTFLEYYCAEDLRLRFEQEQTLKLEDLKNEIYGPHWSDESWHEVLCLLAGALAPRFVTEILQYLLEQSDPEMSCQHIFLAARCIGEVRASVELGDVGVRVRNAVEGLLSVDLPHYYELWSSEAEFLEGIRMKAVHLRATSWPNRTSTKAWLRLRAHSDDKSEVRQAAVRELARGWRGDADTLGWLQGLAEFDDDGLVRQAAMQELVRGWKADANTLSILKACVRFDDHWSAKPAAMQELARGWAADPDAFAILNACIQPDQPSAVRQVAVRELVRGWKARPDTVVWLKNCVQSKDDSAVRETAVEELARGWKAVSDTQTILKELLRGNDDRRIRRAAVRELARGWKADPDTFAILRTWVQSSDDVVVREAAVEELAWGWKGDPDTFAILKTCAQSDGDKVVRRAALKGLGGGWKTDPETVVWLKACARSDNEWLIREAAVRELARGWTADPETLAILKVRAQSDAEADVRKAGVEELARGWNVDPDTLEILKVRAQSDDDADVRRVAVRELARDWKADPNVLAILKFGAQFDNDWRVRETAVRELARGWKMNPEIPVILKGRAQSDDDMDVRAVALSELARSWGADPDTLTIFSGRAQFDDAWPVRVTAVRALAQSWRTDPGTLSILKDRAQSDGYWYVRRDALRCLVRDWKTESDTLRILKMRARSDEAPGVRQCAVYELARGWKTDPDTIEILKTCALSDDELEVRQVAVRELARRWAPDPEITAWLAALPT